MFISFYVPDFMSNTSHQAEDNFFISHRLLILPGLLNTLWTWEGGGRILLPPNSLVFYPRSIKFGM